MNSILIQQVRIDDKFSDVLIEGNKISMIFDSIVVDADKIIDGKNKALIPGFANAHAHSAMTLFKGLGEDIPLMKWLHDYIWPYEAKLDEEMVYWGAKMACLEMIRTGTTVCNDMYWYPQVCKRAMEEMGLRSVQAYVWIDFFDKGRAANHKINLEKMYRESLGWSDLTQFSVGPHAIYSVSSDSLQWISAFAQEHEVMLHIHLAESQTEYEDSIKNWGVTPTKYLHNLGILGPNVVAAHSVWLSPEDIQILGDHGVCVVHNPNSNLKLASGYKFKYDELRDAGVRVCLGTDGCASSNNLDMLEAMKHAAFLQKAWRRDPAAMPLQELMTVASFNGYQAMNVHAGKIEVGMLADLILIDLQQSAFVPCHNFYANLIYAANGSAVDTVLCNGRILMEEKRVEGEAQIFEMTAKMAQKLITP
ncbi:MAG: amidohydrolase [Prevotellaceae bacterium]|jgi:5-methylthioadenosine/S-adenosylhomocysteine deaminase|nr:amidohydrolase [Prevotellaceae bacterium]